MKYYEAFDCGHAVKDPMICISNLEKLGISEEEFKICKSFEHKNKTIQFIVKEKEDDGKPDDVLQNTDILPVFSPRLISALNEAGITGIQYIPVDVVNFKQEKFDGFCIANVMDNISNAFCAEKSICQYYDREDLNTELIGKIDFIWHLAAYSSELNGHDIFRLKFDDRFTAPYGRIIVSEKFKDIFAKNKFTGFSFSKITLV